MQRMFAVIFACLASANAGPLFLVVPNAQTNAAGNNPDSLSGSGGFHTQEVFGSGQFSSVPAEIVITQFAFRAAPNTGPMSLSFTSLNISLSTTQYGPNTGFPMVLTDNFATNIGPDNTLVFSGSLDLNSPGCAGSAPCLFDIIFQLSTPFLYHKNQGRLLLDISGTAASMAGTVDEVEYTFPPGGPVASVSGDPGDATGGFDSGGIIMQIGYTVPEPSMCALVFGGLAVFGALRRRRF